MNRVLGLLLATALAGCFATVGEDGRVVEGQAAFTLSLPAVLPPLVVVHPGVSVVRDLDEEVFYTDGYYWTRHDQGWYRARDHRGGWDRVEQGHVPRDIADSPPGRYRHDHGD